MKIEVLGPGCMKCHKQYDEAQKAVAQAGVEVELVKVERIDQIMTYGVMMTPALVLDGEVKCSGKVAKASEIVAWIEK
jgi:small redox-active disulfide protein 2